MGTHKEVSLIGSAAVAVRGVFCLALVRLGVLLAVFLFTACGPQGPTSEVPTSTIALPTRTTVSRATPTRESIATLMTPSLTPPPAHMTPSPTVSASPTPLTITPQATLLRPGEQPTTDVWVTTDKLDYRRGERIVVTIGNDLSVAIYALTGKTYCTIVSVQRKTDDKWQIQSRCAAGAPPVFIPIPSKSRMSVEIFPRDAFDKELVPGQYRIEFSFRVGSASGPWQTVYSKEFVISD